MRRKKTIDFGCDKHTPMPTGYIAWDDEAKRLAGAGYAQITCGECRLWKIWLKKAHAKRVEAERRKRAQDASLRCLVATAPRKSSRARKGS